MAKTTQTFRIIKDTSIYGNSKAASYDNDVVMIDTGGGLYLGNKSANPNLIATNNFNQLINKPTTLAGYGITDALPKTGGMMTGAISITAAATLATPTAQILCLNAKSSTDDIIAMPGIGFHIPNKGYATLKYTGKFEFMNSSLTGHEQVKASKFITAGGTSSQFVKGDGTLDSGRYLSTSGGTLNGNLRISGILTLPGSESDNDHIENKAYANGLWGTESGKSPEMTHELASIKNAIKFNWYNDDWIIGNVRAGSAASNGFGIGMEKTKSDGTIYQKNVFRLSPDGEIYLNGTPLADKYLSSAGGTLTGGLTVSNTSRLKLNGGILELNTPDGSFGVYLWADKNQGGNTGDLILYSGSKWNKVLHSDNYTNYTVPKTGGTFSGNVGIGTTSPTEKLEVTGNVKATTFKGNLDWSYIQNKPTIPTVNDGKLSIQTNGTEAVSFTANQSSNSTVNFKAGSNVSISNSNGTITISSTDTNTDTKVTSVDNHYTPTENTSSAINASGGSAKDITGTSGQLNVVTGVKRDAKGHIVGVTCANIYSTDANTDTNYYHTPSHSSGLSIATGTGVNALYVPTAGAQSLGVVRGFHRTSGAATGTKTTSASNAPAINSRSTTSGRYYGVETDKDGYMFVNVPWEKGLSSETYKGTVTSITPGTGLTGTSSDTAITSSGTINLKVASSSEIGGVKPGTTSGKTYGVQVNASTGEMTVNVPWTDTDTDTKVTSVGNHYTPTENTSSAINASGGSAKNITGTSGQLSVVTGLKRDAAGHVVGVTCSNIYSTYTDTNTAHSHSAGVGLIGSGNAGTSGTYTYKAALVSETKSSSAASATASNNSNRLYPVSLDKDGKLAVNVPWTDTDTNTDTKVTSADNHYTPSGSSKTGTASGNTLSFGGAVVTGLSYDSKGHVTGFTTSKLPANPNTDTDTKVTQTVTTTNANYPLLLAPSGQTATTTTTSYFATGMTYNPSLNALNLNKPGAIGAMINLGDLDDDGVGYAYIKEASDTLTLAGDLGITLRTGFQNEGGDIILDIWPETEDRAAIRPYSSGTTVRQVDVGRDSQRFYNGYFSNQVLAAGGFYKSSDERLKTFENSLEIDLDKLSECKKSYFRFNDKPEEKHIGVSAQEIQKLYPEVVTETEDGYLSVDYSALSVVCLAAIDKLYAEIKELKKMIK